MGLSSKKTKTKSTSQEQSHQVNAPTNAPWVEPTLAGLAERINGLSLVDPQSFVAPPSALQTQAFQAASQRLSQPNLGYDEALAGIRAAAGAPPPTVQAASIDPAATFAGTTAYGGIDQYLSPYTREVIDASTADIDHQAALADAQARGQAASAGAWSGDGAQVLRAITNANYSRDKASTIANLRNTGWNTALGASQQDAQRAQDAAAANAAAYNGRASQQAQLAQQAALANQQAQADALSRQLAAGQAIGGLARDQDAAYLAALQAAGTLGETQRGITQQQLSAPISLLQSQTGLLGQLPLNLLHGETTDHTGNSSGTSSTRESGATLGDWASLLKSLADLKTAF